MPNPENRVTLFLESLKPRVPPNIRGEINNFLQGNPPEAYTIPLIEEGEILFNAERGSVYSEDGASSQLTPSEANILAALIIRPNRIVSHENLISYLFPREEIIGNEKSSLQVHVCNLRGKLEEVSPQLSKRIETCRGEGYLWNDSDEPLLWAEQSSDPHAIQIEPILEVFNQLAVAYDYSTKALAFTS